MSLWSGMHCAFAVVLETKAEDLIVHSSHFDDGERESSGAA